MQFNKQSQGGSIIIQLINPDDSNRHLLLLSYHFFLLLLTVCPFFLTKHLFVLLILPIICVVLFLIYDVIRAGLLISNTGTNAITRNTFCDTVFSILYTAWDKDIYTVWFILGKSCTSTNQTLSRALNLWICTLKVKLFFTFLTVLKGFETPVTLFQLNAAMAFWASVWSASLFPVQTESHRRKLCLLSWALSRSPVKFQGLRDMLGISASIRIEHSRYILKEPSP